MVWYYTMSYPVIVSYSNTGYIELAKNMLLSLDRVVRHHRVHMYCLDDNTFDTLTQLSFQHVTVTFELYRASVSAEFELYGTPEYNSITHLKMDILKKSVFKYKFIHFIDGDVVCMKEPPLEHYLPYQMYDVVFQEDNGMSAHTFSIWCCTGNTTFRNTPGTHYLLQKIKEYQHRYPGKNDQECLFQWLCDLSLTDIRYCQPCRLYMYDKKEYTPGYMSPDSLTYFFHANHVIGYDAKVALLKQANQWFL